jgi:hypothetical protein
MLGSLGVLSGWSGHSDLTNLANLTNLAKPKTLLDGNERFCSRGARYPAAITSVTAPSKTRILEPKSTQLANVNLWCPSQNCSQSKPAKVFKPAFVILCYFLSWATALLCFTHHMRRNCKHLQRTQSSFRGRPCTIEAVMICNGQWQ